VEGESCVFLAVGVAWCSIRPFVRALGVIVSAWSKLPNGTDVGAFLF
jgi:hypothetical protein